VTAAALLLHCAETPVGVSFPAGFSFLSFFFLLPDCLSRFSCRYPWFFGSSVSVVPLSLSIGFSLFRFLSPFAAVLSFLSFFFPLSSLLHSDGIYRAGGAGTTLPRPIAAHGARSRRSTLSQQRLRRPMGTLLAGHGLSVFSS